MKRLLRCAVLLGAGLVLALPLAFAGTAATTAQAAPTAVQDFAFASYDADYYLGQDASGHATLRTVETLVAVFPNFDQNRGIIRAIPNYYDGVPLETRVIEIVDEQGTPVPYEVLSSGKFTELALGTDDFVHGRTTYVITYEQRNVVRAFADTNADEFYWDANGTGWAQPFAEVSVRVHVAPELVELLTGDAACYAGAFGETKTCEITRVDEAEGTLFSAQVGPLIPHETLTVAIGFAPGTFVQVEPVEVPGQSGPDVPFTPLPFTEIPWVGPASIASVLLIVFGTAFTIVWRFLRPAGSKGSGIIIPQYTAPKDLNLLEAAGIIGRSRSGVQAQIVSFAVRGKLRILDYPVRMGGPRYSVQLLSLDGLDRTELAVMSAIFGGAGVIVPQVGAVQEVGIVDDLAASALTRVQSGVRTDLISRGLIQKRSPALGIIAAIVMFVMSFVSMGLFVLSTLGGPPNLWGLAGFMLAIFAVFVCLGFAFRPAVPTAAGAAHHDYLLGILDYLKLAEEDRFRMLQSPEGAQRVRAEGLDPRHPAQRVKLYEKLLPFAVLWGVEREWSKELAILYGASAPDWFVTTGSFDASSFSFALGSIATSTVVRQTASISSSSWSGSSGGSFSGGSSGGGFSGGGGGGGGGGGR